MHGSHLSWPHLGTSIVRFNQWECSTLVTEVKLVSVAALCFLSPQLSCSYSCYWHEYPQYPQYHPLLSSPSACKQLLRQMLVDSFCLPSSGWLAGNLIRHQSVQCNHYTINSDCIIVSLYHCIPLNCTANTRFPVIVLDFFPQFNLISYCRSPMEPSVVEVIKRQNTAAATPGNLSLTECCWPCVLPPPSSLLTISSELQFIWLPWLMTQLNLPTLTLVLQFFLARH